MWVGLCVNTHLCVTLSVGIIQEVERISGFLPWSTLSPAVSKETQVIGTCILWYLPLHIPVCLLVMFASHSNSSWV